jgi:hypothetical protein
MFQQLHSINTIQAGGGRIMQKKRQSIRSINLLNLICLSIFWLFNKSGSLFYIKPVYFP